MKMHIKALGTAALMAASFGVSAAPIYMDVGTNFDPNPTPAGLFKECPTCTGVKEQLTFVYDSFSTIIDANGNGAPDIGETIITDGGLFLPAAQGGGGLPANLVTNLIPAEVLGQGSSNNGYGTDWLMSFNFTGLTGTIVGFSGALPIPQYGPGNIDLYLTFDGTTFNNFMDLAVNFGIPTGLNLTIAGDVDFTNVDAGFNDLFHFANSDCGGDDSFFAHWQNCQPVGVQFIIDQNTDPLNVTLGIDGNGNITVTSNHDGSIVFVPEPGTMALFGAALLGFGGLARKRAQQRKG